MPAFNSIYDAGETPALHKKHCPSAKFRSKIYLFIYGNLRKLQNQGLRLRQQWGLH